MSGISNLFNIASSGLFAFQKALSVTAHNMANVNTPGYSRQEIALAETLPLNGRPGQIGTGVQVLEIKRKVDDFVNAQLLSSRERLGQFDASHRTLADIERLFGDGSTPSLGTDLNDLFRAFQDVATHPDDLTARTVLLAKARTLAERFHHADDTLALRRQGIDQEIGHALTEANHLAARVAALNQQISTAELSGQHANDLRDERQRVLGDLAELIDITTLEDTSGQVTIFIGSGHLLVDKGTARTVSGVPNAGNGGLMDVQYDQSGTPVSISQAISGGRLQALLALRDQTIPDLRARLDTLAATVVSQINAQHQAGYGLDGGTGRNFFSPTGTTAGSIAVNLTDGRHIAASGTAAGVPGNNANALLLAEIQNASLATLGHATLGQYYALTAARIGSAAQKAARDHDAQQLIHDQLQAQWAQVSGVSLDEELVNMMKYQRAFQAASKLIVMTDELMQTILTMKR